MSLHTQSSMSFIFDEVVSAVAYNEFLLDPAFFPRLYNVRPAAKGRRERFAAIGGLGQFQLKQEGQSSTEQNVVQQFEKTYTHSAYALQASVSREVIDDNEFSFFEQLGREIGMAAARKMETDAAGTFSNAFGSALSEDGLSLCNAAHLNVDGGNSQSNTGTSALSQANLKTARNTMRKFTDYRGERIVVNPDGLIVPSDLEETAWELVRSELKPGTANNDRNIFNGMMELFVWIYLNDDTNDWFLVDQRLMKRHLMWLQRAPLEVFGDGDLFKGQRKIGGYMRYSFGAKDWRWIYGNSVT